MSRSYKEQTLLPTCFAISKVGENQLPKFTKEVSYKSAVSVRAIDVILMDGSVVTGIYHKNTGPNIVYIETMPDDCSQSTGKFSAIRIRANAFVKSSTGAIDLRYYSFFTKPKTCSVRVKKSFREEYGLTEK